MSRIKNIIASEIINSRGYPTIYGRLITDKGEEVVASVPSHEQLYDFQRSELRDKDMNRFNGNGVQKAVSYINTLIAPKLKNVSVDKQSEIDNWLSKSNSGHNKDALGVNTTLIVSYLIAKAAAKCSRIPLYKYFNNFFKKVSDIVEEPVSIPSPIFPILKGGKHGQINLDFKEFQIIPSSAFGYFEAYQSGVDLYHLVRHAYKFGFNSNMDVIIALKDSVEKKGLAFGRDLFLGINFGATAFYSGNRYSFRDRQQPISSEEYIKFINEEILKKYSPLMIIDPMPNNDNQNWAKLQALVPKETYLVADTYISSNRDRLEKAIKDKLCSAVVIRPNQVGTLTETLLILDYAQRNQITCQLASELGETDEDIIADLSVGVQVDFVNFGPPVHSENVAKYNRLLEIDREISIKK